jgi:microcystin-dependent protein
MSDHFVGEIRMFGGNFAPLGWAMCDGALLPIAQNDVLFALIGTTYGGDGVTTFALPDLRGRVPLHQGSGFIIGEQSGTETETLVSSQMPSHTHGALGQSSSGSMADPTNGTWAASSLVQFSPDGPNALMNPACSGVAGQSQPHDNMMPFQTLTFIIALFGVFPSQN